MEISRVRPQNLQHRAALLRVRFAPEHGLKRGLSGATLQLPQAAFICGYQVRIAEFCDCNNVKACSGAQCVLLQHKLCIARAGGCLGEVSGRVGCERGIA